MQGYDKNDLFAEGIESKSWKNEFLKKAQTNFYDSKKKLERGVRSFFPRKCKRGIDEGQKDALINAIHLCNGINMIIKLFKHLLIFHTM